MSDTEMLATLASYSGDPWRPNNPYFAKAEKAMDPLWERLVFPFIKDCDFTSTLDLAAGHGRNSIKLLELCKELTILDIQPGNIEVCRKRFEANKNVRFVICNGYDFQPVQDSSVTLIYCFDAMVHFDSDVVRSYLRDAKRILKSGGRGFFHHSNYTGSHDWKRSVSARNFMSDKLFEHYAIKEGLTVERQMVTSWDGVTDLDCLSLIRKNGD